MGTGNARGPVHDPKRWFEGLCVVALADGRLVIPEEDLLAKGRNFLHLSEETARGVLRRVRGHIRRKPATALVRNGLRDFPASELEWLMRDLVDMALSDEVLTSSELCALEDHCERAGLSSHFAWRVVRSRMPSGLRRTRGEPRGRPEDVVEREPHGLSRRVVNRARFKAAVLAAWIDGRLSRDEKRRIHELAQRFEISPEDHRQVVRQLREHVHLYGRVLLPKAIGRMRLADALRLMHDVADVMLSDGVLTWQELELLEDIAGKFRFGEEVAWDTISEIVRARLRGR